MCVFRRKSAETPEGEPDDVQAIDTMIKTLAEEGKEIPLIVQTVYDCYQRHIRPEVRYTSPVTGMNIDKPEWTTESIQRHIVGCRPCQIGGAAHPVADCLYSVGIFRELPRIV